MKSENLTRLVAMNRFDLLISEVKYCINDQDWGFSDQLIGGLVVIGFSCVSLL